MISMLRLCQLPEPCFYVEILGFVLRFPFSLICFCTLYCYACANKLQYFLYTFFIHMHFLLHLYLLNFSFISFVNIKITNHIDVFIFYLINIQIIFLSTYLSILGILNCLFMCFLNAKFIHLIIG